MINLLGKILGFLSDTTRRIDGFKNELNGSYEGDVKKALDDATSALSKTTERLKERKKSLEKDYYDNLE